MYTYYGVGKCFKCKKPCVAYSGMRWISDGYYNNPSKGKSYIRLWCKSCSFIINNPTIQTTGLHYPKPSKYYKKRKKKYKK